MPIAIEALELYRNRRGPFPVGQCIDGDGRSCSQRFEAELNAALEEGQSEPTAAWRAFRETVIICSKINATTLAMAALKLVAGTTTTIVAPHIAKDCCQGYPPGCKK